jgi:hypothetical protein
MPYLAALVTILVEILHYSPPTFLRCHYSRSFSPLRAHITPPSSLLVITDRLDPFACVSRIWSSVSPGRGIRPPRVLCSGVLPRCVNIVVLTPPGPEKGVTTVLPSCGPRVRDSGRKSPQEGVRTLSTPPSVMSLWRVFHIGCTRQFSCNCSQRKIPRTDPVRRYWDPRPCEGSKHFQTLFSMSP